MNKTCPRAIEGGESEFEVDSNQLIILRVQVWVGERCITNADTSCLHNFLKVWKQLFYEKELSESIDERYLSSLEYATSFNQNECFLSEIMNVQFLLKILVYSKEDETYLWAKFQLEISSIP